jgi:thiosulfate/3-mercaptopyruvate sulfurtransferase
VPGAVNVSWAENLQPERRFKSPAPLRAPYTDHGITADDPVVAYCRVGERSSITWFALSELLGFDRVANDDGHWTKLGNLVGVPIETGATSR